MKRQKRHGKCHKGAACPKKDPLFQIDTEGDTETSQDEEKWKI